jgi:hypothetical protein
MIDGRNEVFSLMEKFLKNQLTGLGILTVKGNLHLHKKQKVL